MTEDKKKLSKLCLTGFIFSVLPLVILALVYFFSDELSITAYTIATVVIIVSPIAGLILSIIGLISGGIKSKKGKGFGIAGIAFPLLYGTALVGVLVWFVVSIVTGMNAESRNKAKSDIYNMGSVWKIENEEYDVSQYRITEEYELHSSDATSSETELNRYAGNRLDTITKGDENYIRGKCENYDFLIIRRDRYSEWRKNDRIGSVNYYPDGYATIDYTYMWEFAAGRPCTLDMYKDPSDKYIIITNCGDYKVITEFFETA